MFIPNCIKENLSAIVNKYEKVKLKHPRLCDKWSSSDIYSLSESLDDIQQHNDLSEKNGFVYFDELIKEELLEFLVAVKANNLKESRKELIDIIILCFRALAKIRNH